MRDKNEPPRENGDTMIAENLGHLLNHARTNTWNLINQRTRDELDVSGTEASIISMLARDCELVAVDLAREYGIDASAVTRIVDRMEKRGLVVRVRSKEDRRVVKLALTAVGTGIAERIPAIFARVQDDLLAGMTSEETGFLLSILGRVLRNGRHVQEHADKASSRVANRLVV